MARRKIAVDDRTENLSDAALYCRSKGHAWEEKSLSRSRFRDLFRQGLTEENEFCATCGCTQLRIVDVATGELVGNPKRNYPSEGYLLPKNSGRLPRAQARVARFNRLYQAYS